MQIKKLELAGFKSFMNPVALDFGGGITAILGPNGCGKSNVVDAVRWVLGEQSAKQLRGENMQNVVFGGTRTRKPLGLAEVSVSFANNQGRLPIAYEEVKITRRLTRDGQSDYLLNGASCRLKDIKDLITDTGAGSHGYAIIEREQVDLVVNDHEDSRRFLFEEASGIMKYRLRRKEALRKLELTEQDMLRLNDIIEEIARTVRSLRRQMGRARRYQELQESLRKSDTYMAQHRLRESLAEALAFESQLEGMRAADLGENVAGDAIAAHIEALRVDLVATEQAWREAGGNVDRIASQLKTEEENLLVLRERSDSARDSKSAAEGEIGVTETRLTQVRADRARLEAEHAEFETRLAADREAFRARKEQLAESESRHEVARGDLLQIKQRSFDFAQDSAARRGELDLLRAKLETQEARAREVQEELDIEAARIAKLADEHAEAGSRVDAAAEACQERHAGLGAVVQRLEDLTEHLEARREERADLNSRLEATRSRHELLHSMIEAFEGYGEGARSLLQRKVDSGPVLGTLADHVEAPVGLEAAYDVLLHDVLDALLVRDAEGAVDLLRELRGEKLGRATLMLREAPYEADISSLADLRGRPGVVGLAIDLLPAHGAARLTLRGLLARAVVVESVEVAMAILAERRDATLRIATRDGLLVTGAGALCGGSERDRDVQLLGRRQRRAELEEEMHVVQGELKLVAQSLMSLEGDLAATRDERLRLESALRAEEAQHHDLALSRATLETLLAEASARRAQAGALHATLETEIAATASKLPELTSSAEALGREGEDHGRALANREQAFADLDREREQLRHEVGELRVAFVTLQGEAESHARQLERLGELERELGDIGTRRRDEIARAERDLERYAGELEAAAERAMNLAQELAAARTAQNEIGLQLDSQRGAIDAEQEHLHEIEKARREQQGQRHAAEMGLSECRLRRQNLLDRVFENYRLNESELLALAFEWTDEDPVPDEAQIRSLKEELARLGPVNLLALEEHEEKAARLEFLEAQRQDLIQASASLTETIEKINRTAHFLFMETFEQIRGHFRDTIITVFDGGEGDLVLSNPDNPLESDIEILVRPRGKKIDTLTQLSSGERALTAIALLFSIYLVKPSPFCVFDEVDAPLDDANIGRFVNLLQEFKDRTQFIVITHNKLTMEAADRLYGVTMEEEGVSKLVSVALDGELKGQPKQLKKKTERVARAAALLTPSVEALTGMDTVVAGGEDGALHAAARLDTSPDLEPSRGAARLETAHQAGTALLEPEADLGVQSEFDPPGTEETRV